MQPRVFWVVSRSHARTCTILANDVIETAAIWTLIRQGYTKYLYLRKHQARTKVVDNENPARLKA
jgi:hypothetical protein